MPKLTYFDIPASRGEECRLALYLAGVDFEDVRVSFQDWPALKPNTPFGSMPLFEIEGKPVLSQTNAILGLIGRGHGLHPKDNWEAARHESLMAAVEDLRHAVVARLRAPEERKVEARAELANEVLPQWAERIERQLDPAPAPFLAGEAISVADIKLYMVERWFSSGSVDLVPADVFVPFTRLKALTQAVAAHPKVVEWYARGR